MSPGINRGSFGTWGAELDDVTFAAALAALGVASERPEPNVRYAVGMAWRQGELRWRLPELAPQPIDPHALSDGWFWTLDQWRADHLQGDPRNLGTMLSQLTVEWPSDEDPRWLVEQLSREAIGPLSVHIARPAPEGRTRWTWPLDLGFLDDPASEALAQLVASPGDFERSPFVTPRRLAGGGTCDLLLVPERLRAAVGPVLSGAIRASCVLLLRPSPEHWEVTAPVLRALQAHTGASGIGFVPVPRGRAPDWLWAVLTSLSHDHPLDVALRLAALATKTPSPLLIADNVLLQETRLSTVMQRLETRAMRAAPPDDPVRSGADDGPPLVFDRESHGASELVRRRSRLRPYLDEPDAERFIQAQISTAGGERLHGPLVPGADHLLGVRIGPPDEEWTSATGDSFPTPAGGETHCLTVVLTAPDVIREPLMDEILLPPSGPSTECTFLFDPGTEVTRLRGRIIVLHGNRVLQTARLDLPVGGDADAELSLTAEPEAAVRLRLDDLDTRRPFDAALVVNHDENGTPGVTAIAGGRARVMVPSEFKKAVDRIRDMLEEAVLEPVGYDGLADPSTVKLLRKLAYNGFTLHEAFLQGEGAESVVDAERLQVVAVRPGADFPLEFVYDGVAPEPDAVLCPGAEAGLRTGSCGGDCGRGDDPHLVCPLAFWGLTKSIERQPYGGTVENYDLEVRSEPSGEINHLSAPNAALFAASCKVRDEDVTALATALGTATHDKATRATSWQEWRDSVANTHPPLLVLLPHTLPDPEFDAPAMEIADDLPLARNNIREDLVCPSREHRPVVLLLGCNTAATAVPIEDFPPRFRSQGAAIVLGTVTKVLGRHAAPLAGRIATELADRASTGETYITDMVRDLRRTLLADGRPMGLTLVAYGDGEWIFGGP